MIAPAIFTQRFLAWVFMLAVGISLVPSTASANPVFARQYNLSCSACHAAYPRLNSFGRNFAAANLRLPNWKEQVTLDTGDSMLALPKVTPVGFRVQGYAQTRSADVTDNTGKTTHQGDYDIQAPYLIKLFSSAPLSDEMSYYFYAMMAEKGSNGEILVEDAWMSYDNLLGSGLRLTAGQFQLSDLMFPRETRLTFQDFIPYRMAGITYDRGAQLSTDLNAPINVTFGVTNGNGITAQKSLNSAGFNRPDHTFDNNRSKTLFGRAGASLGEANAGLFVAQGKRDNAAGPSLIDSQVLGLDMSYNVDDKLFLFAQLLQVDWKDFLGAGKSTQWMGGFAGVDYVHSDHWVFSALYNFADNKDFKNTGTVYEGIGLNSLTGTASYYVKRNVKLLLEANYDLLATDTRDGVGHDTQEHYFLVGFDAGF
ncbi:MAG: hypothetical protein OEW58_11590 [Gammaproteobacteria bacterium]|nr:hypothetical protein [Gammaproteobacteria bacterium]